MSQQLETRQCSHKAEVVATYTTGDKYFLCQKCYSKPLFSKSEFLVSLVEIISEEKN